MVRLLALVPLIACNPDLVVDDVGACELRYSEIAGIDGPVSFCLQSALSDCAWVQASHGADDLGFWPHETCPASGFPVCCGTETVHLWFESRDEADAARTQISGDPCQPCSSGPV
ncbi:MAG: hypothetical protein R3F61_12500 [Myxococcota bacterium]